MRIAINALSAQTGAGVSVLVNLLPHLARIDTANSYTVFYSYGQQGFVQAIPERFHKVAVGSIPHNPYLRVLWEQFVFPFYLLWHRIDVLCSLGNTTSILVSCKIVLWMVNASPYSSIDLSWSRSERWRLAFLRTLGRFSAWRATKIRFISENSRDLIIPQLGVSLKKCVVIPYGVSNVSSPFQGEVRRGYEYGTPTTPSPSYEPPPTPPWKGRERRGNPYLLAIGANGPHRNLARLIKAFSMLVNQYGYQGNLIIVGDTGSAQHRQGLDNAIQEGGLSQRVRLEGEVPHHRISSYFKYADVFVFSSIEETFGVSLIEAMGFGVPIAASDCDLDAAYRGKCFNPFREICGTAAQYFNPFEVNDMAECIQRLLGDPALRERLIAQGKIRVENYDLENTARTLVRLFDTIGSPH